MSAPTSLLVPIRVEALVVNDKVRMKQNFQRWRMNYRNLEDYASPMPNAFSGNTAADWNNEPDANGIYLHWKLPRALRHGMQDASTHQTNYPLVPNRWLVTRIHGPLHARVQTSWVVESDYLNPTRGSTPFVDPFSEQHLKITSIGCKMNADGWQEKATNPMFLTAAGAGDITFSAYQPYVRDVFSIHDPLTGITADTVSYLINGWYADASKDPLAGITSEAEFSAAMATLGWSVDDSVTDVCDRSLYCGASTAANYDTQGDIPASDRPDTATLALGNTSIDALTALIHEQAADTPDVDTDLLEAFQYNLLPILDQPNGQLVLERAIHEAWFGAATGRFDWVIVHDPDDPDSSPTDPDYPDRPVNWSDPDLDPAWLGKLNRDQTDCDQAISDLGSFQQDLYAMWWTRGRFEHLPGSMQQALHDEDPRFTDKTFQDELDPTRTGSLANKVAQQAAKAQSLAAKVPEGATASELEEATKAYAKANGLPQGYQLKRYNGDSFHHPNDPVVLIAGANSSDSMTEEAFLACRVPAQMVKGLTYESKPVDVAMMQGTIPTPDLTNMPALSAALFVDGFFLDSANATMIATIALGDPSQATIDGLTKQLIAETGLTGVPPSVTRAPWVQPWTPLFILWMVRFYPIEFEKDGTPNWQFNGNTYTLIDPNLPELSPESFVMSGTTLLTPQASFNFRRRLEHFRKEHPDLDASELDALNTFIAQTDNWDFLSQTLDGFSQILQSRDAETNVIPGTESTTGQMIGQKNSIVPNHGAAPQPFEGWPKSDFQQVRSGQFCFEKLSVVDAFGQTIELVTSQNYQRFKPVRTPDFVPEKPVLSQEPDRFVEMRPRILQPARLAFQFVSATDDEKIVNRHSGTNPICAWVMPNHVDKSLGCYTPEGLFIGHLRVVTDTSGTRIVNWMFGPDAPFSDLTALNKALPHLGEMIAGLIEAGVDALEGFSRTIDQALWTIDPLGARQDQDLSVLVGRPLALTRVRLDYELLSPAKTDPAWQHVFTPADPTFEDYKFPIRLGEVALRDDGLIGYFKGKNYAQFDVVRLPTATILPIGAGYIQLIEEGNFIDIGFAPASDNYLTMLVDPRGSVHATTGILPQVSVTIPPEFIEPALQSMEVTYHAGPLLARTTTVQKKGNGEPNTSVVLPLPAERNGVWDWVHLEGDVWKPLAIQDSDTNAVFSNEQSALRTGMMRLRGGLSKN